MTSPMERERNEKREERANCFSIIDDVSCRCRLLQLQKINHISLYCNQMISYLLESSRVEKAGIHQMMAYRIVMSHFLNKIKYKV